MDFPSESKKVVVDSEGEAVGPTFTWRASLLGSFLGCIVAAGNVYLGLKTGFGSNASLFSSIAAFGIFKALEKGSGATFGMQENCAAQTAASAASSISGGYVAPIPAMFRLGLLPKLQECWPTLLIWTMAGAIFALSFAVPLRSYFVVQKNLIYPTPTAVAHTIRALHSGSESSSRTQTKWMFASFVYSFGHRLLSLFLPFLAKTHLFYGMGVAMGSEILKQVDLFYGWRVEGSGAVAGAGLMLGLHMSISMALGSTFLWGAMSPILISRGIVTDKSPFGFPLDSITVQGWGLWVGIVVVLCSSLADILSQYRMLGKAAGNAFAVLHNLAGRILPLERREVDSVVDPEPKENLVPTWAWLSGLVLGGSAVLVLLSVSFGLSLGNGVLAMILGLLFSLVGCQCAATTDINPVGVLAKGSQVIFSTLPASSPAAAQMSSLCAGALTASCASQTVDTVGDLKTGHLLNASPRGLIYSQFMGSMFGAIASVGMFYLFSSAYPCIVEEMDEGMVCEYPAPFASAWVGITRALTTGIDKFIPTSCRIACLVFAIVTLTSTIIKNNLPAKYSVFFPNWNAFGIGFFIPSPSLAYVLLSGAIAGSVFRRIDPDKYKLVGVVLAAGLIAGEGISGIFIALLALAGVSQKNVATGFACPDFSPAKC